MTDNEIINALACCQSNDSKTCRWCCYRQYRYCREVMARYALDLINRQKAENKEIWEERCRIYDSLQEAKAEIERLKSEAQMADGYADALIERTKAEAIKEFAEWLKKHAKELHIGDNISLQVVGVGRIDNLVKEMTEGSYEKSL